MGKAWKGLICLALIFAGRLCLAASTQIQDTAQIADSETINSLQGRILSQAPDLSWQMDLELTTYQNKLETGDKVTLFRSDLEFQFASDFLVGGGLDYGYSALEKMTNVDPHLLLGFRVQRAEARVTLFTNEFRQGASPSQSSSGNVLETDTFLFTMSGTALDLRAQFTPWLDGRFYWLQQTSSTDFSRRSTGKTGTSFAARRMGPIISTVEEVPRQVQTFQLVFHPAPQADVDFQHNRSQELLSGEWSADTGALLKVRVGPFWTVGFGLGENSFRSQSQRYALAHLGYQF